MHKLFDKGGGYVFNDLHEKETEGYWFARRYDVFRVLHDQGSTSKV